MTPLQITTGRWNKCRTASDESPTLQNTDKQFTKVAAIALGVGGLNKHGLCVQ